MFYRYFLAVGAAALLLALSAAPVRAALIVGNITGSGSTNQALSNSSVRLGSSVVFDGTFTPHNLTSVTLLLATNSSTFTGTVGVELFADIAGAPGTLAVDLGTTTVSGLTLTPYSFTPATPFTLQPNSTYWVIGRYISGATAVFGYSNSGLEGGSDPAASIPLTRIIGINSGATYNPPTTGTAYRLRLDGDPVVAAVPEPSSLVLLATGAVGLGAARRKRKTARGISA